MNTGTFGSGRFDSIQAMRGLAALSVVFHHISFIGNGAFGVDIFFCISGFIMMHVTHISTDSFFLKRIIRIVPLYYFMTFVTYAGLLICPSLFDNTSSEPLYLLKSCLFLTPMFGGEFHPVVKVGWTLNYEMLFYAVIWISFHISKKYRGIIASVIIVCIVAAGNLMNVNNTIMIEFIYGIAAYEILKRIAAGGVFERKSGVSLKFKCAADVIMLITAVAAYVFMWCAGYTGASDLLPRVIVYGIPAFVLFVFVFIAGFNKKIPRAFVYPGDISYSMYLMHYFIARFFSKYGGEMPKTVVVAAVVSFTILSGAVSYNVFEKKITKWLKEKVIKRRKKETDKEVNIH